MYIQITSRCNMACAHCIYSCGLKKGRHMSMDTFRQAVLVAESYDSPITIGGGEPTLHPDLLAMLGIASLTADLPPFMVTNGTCSKKLWSLLMRAQKREHIDVRVSNDLWHDTSMIRDWVREDADCHKLWWGDKSNDHRTLIRQGRAKRNWKKLLWECEQSGIRLNAIESECGYPRVAPDGRVWADVPGGGAMGIINDPDSFAKAYDTIQKYEDSK